MTSSTLRCEGASCILISQGVHDSFAFLIRLLCRLISRVTLRFKYRGWSGGGLACAQEVRDAIKDFRDSGGAPSQDGDWGDGCQKIFYRGGRYLR